MGYKRKPIRLRPKKSILKNRYLWLVVLILFLFLLIIYFLLFWEKFQVAQINVFGNEKVLTENVKNIVFAKIQHKFLFLKSRSIFLVNSKVLSDEILNSFPQIGKVKTSRRFPNIIIVDIKERKAIAVFCADSGLEKCFFIDKTAIIVEQTVTIPKNTLIMRSRLNVEDSRLQEPEQFKKGEYFLGKEAVGKEIVGIILKIQKNLSDNFQIIAQEANIVSTKRLNIKTNENWEIYIGLDSDIDSQITKLNLLLKEEVLAEKRKKLKYIDLRFQDRAYYK